MEFEASTRTQETTFSFGYQMELPEAKMVFKGKEGRYTHCVMYHKLVTEKSFLMSVFTVFYLFYGAPELTCRIKYLYHVTSF